MADFLTMRIPVVEDPQLKKAFQRIKDRNMQSVFQEYGAVKMAGQARMHFKPLSDRQELDGIVFDALKLTRGERDAVYEAVLSLVDARLKKAHSMKGS